MFTVDQLIAFERDIAILFEDKRIHSPVHFSGGNEAALIDIFKSIRPSDYVFSTWRSHYHAFLHGIPPMLVKERILEGKSMNLNFPEYRFYSSAIVGGTLPIACGVAAGGNRVWCFVGDMTASIGAFADAVKFVKGRGLPLTFIVEDNGLATNTPTVKAWGEENGICAHLQYHYQRTYPHVGLTKHVQF